MKHYFLGTNASISKKERVYRRKTKADADDYYALEKYLAERYTGQAFVTRNGRSAIAAVLKYGFDKPGDVIINGFTCYAVVQGITAAGWQPIYADIDRKTLNFTAETLKKSLTKNTKAIIIQNSLGHVVDITSIEKFARKHHLAIIEDLAHCVGRTYADGREVGTVGDFTILSFGKEKSVDAGGGGAAIFRSNQKLDLPELNTPPEAKEEFRARIYPTLGHIYCQTSYAKLNGILMRSWLKLGLVQKSADDEVDYDKFHLSFFQAKLALKKLKVLEAPTPHPLRDFYFVKNRAEVLRKLRSAGYFFDGFWYEKPVSPERYYKRVNFPEDSCPNAVFVSGHIINFPTHYTPAELKKARDIIKPYLIKEADR